MKFKIKNVLFYLRYLPSLLLLIIRINKQLNKLITHPRLPTAAREKLQHPKVKHRVVQYALIHVILNSSIARYHGRKLNNQEFLATLAACASGPFFDDFFDEFGYSKSELFNLLQDKTTTHPDATLDKNPGELAYTYLLYIVYQNIKDKDRFYTYFYNLYLAQWESKNLNNNNLTRDETNLISQNKGGYSALVFRSLIQEPISEVESKMLFQLGVVGQFMDDIFDLFDDYQKGLKTLANDFDLDFKPIVSRFQNEIIILKNLIETLPISKHRKQKFELEIQLIISAGNLACQHFLNIQAEHNGTLELSKIDRKSMIIDMENWRNQFKMLLISISHNQSY